jgi:acyl dehydratase
MSIPRSIEDDTVDAQRRSTGRTITKADVVLHAGQTGDFYPRHRDAERPRRPLSPAF